MGPVKYVIVDSDYRLLTIKVYWDYQEAQADCDKFSRISFNGAKIMRLSEV